MLQVFQQLQARLGMAMEKAFPEAAAAARTTAARRTGTILGFVHAQRTTLHRIAVERLDRSRGIFLRHFDEAEATGTTRFTIHRQRNRFDGAML